MKTTNSSTPGIVGALAIATIIGAAAYVFTQSSGTTSNKTALDTSQMTTATKETTGQSTADATDSQATTDVSMAHTGTTNASSSPSSGYKDGTYIASANYSVPHGNNSIGVSITLSNGVVSAVKTTHDYADRESGMYVDSFDSSINSVVTGKSLEILTSLSRVGGASLTTFGFEDAVASIANQAKA